MPITAKTGWSRITLMTLFQSQGAMALDPDPECLLAGLMDIVPELAKPGKPQGLIGDPAGPVIDHEDKSAGQQQQPHKAEETADHVSPLSVRRKSAVSP